jgi:alkylmercury lyase
MDENISTARRITALIDRLAERWAGADRATLRQLFPLLATEGPVPVDKLAEVTGRSGRDLDALLESGRAGRDERGRLIELFGISIDPTRHRVEVDRRALFACCALVAQVVPPLVDRPARIESIDPISRRIVRLDVEPGGVRRTEPPGAAACLVLPDRDAMAADVGAAVCTHIRHFESPGTRDRFISADRRRFGVGIDQLHSAALTLHERIWPS